MFKSLQMSHTGFVEVLVFIWAFQNAHVGACKRPTFYVVCKCHMLELLKSPTLGGIHMLPVSLGHPFTFLRSGFAERLFSWGFSKMHMLGLLKSHTLCSIYTSDQA